MIPEVLLLAWSSVIWTLLAVVVFFICIILTAIILIQDSKDTGLTSAFGGAGGGSALMGARMQKDLAKLTAILGAILAISLLIMGFITTGSETQSFGAEGSTGAVEPTSATSDVGEEGTPSEAEPANAPAEKTATESSPEGEESE
jgi:preprotein translocase subunit SecG